MISGVLSVAPYAVLTVQGALMLVDEGLFHRWRVLGRVESWSHVVDTLIFVAALCIAAFAPATTPWLRAFVALAVTSSLLITKDEWIHTKECVAGEHWIHSLLFVIHPLVLIAIGGLWLRGENGTLRYGAVASSLVFALYQWGYWIGAGHARGPVAPDVNNKFYEDLGSLWFEGEHHAQALLRKENVARLDYLNQLFAKEGIRKGARILDIGCGGALASVPLAAAGFEVKAIDQSDAVIAAARARWGKIERLTYSTGDAYALDEPEASFDAVLLLDILEHLEHPGRALEQAARVLKPGGLLVFHTFNRTWLAWLAAIHGIKLLVADVPKNLHVYRLFIKPQELTGAGERAGLVLRDLRGIKPRLFHRSAVASVLRRRLDPEFSFVLCRSVGIGYLGYFAKGAQATA